MQGQFSIPQSIHLTDTVCAFWQLQRNDQFAVRETIIPKGVMEVIFSFETTGLSAEINHCALAIPKCFVQGFHSIPIHLHHKGHLTFFGVVLHPSAAKYIFRIPPVEFVNRVIDLTLVDSSFYMLWQHLGEQDTFKKRVTVFTNWLSKQLPHLTDREKAINGWLLNHTDIDLSVSEMAARFCYSPKQLSRKLFELTGMNTEQTLLYKKYLRSIGLMHTTDLSLTEIAYQCRFYDQSHFIKTFRSLAQCTPKAYRLSKSEIFGHIVEHVL